MSDLFNELGDDIREEQLRNFWKENGAWIIGGVLMAIVATGGVSLWKSWQEKNNRRMTAGLIEVLNQEDIEKLDAFAHRAGKNHRALALLLEAGLYVQRNERTKALEKLDALAGDRMAPGIWRDLAKTHAAALRLDEKDGADMKVISGLARDKKNPWAPLALELQALSQSQRQDYTAAAATLADIAADPRASDGVKARAVSLRDYYAAQSKSTQK